MRSIDSGDADRIDPQHENSISGHTGSHGNDRFHIAPDMTVPGHNQFSQGLPAGKRLLGPWKRSDDVVFAVKFSHDGRFIATATWHSILIYDSRSGNLVVDVPIKVTLSLNYSLAWSSDSKHLFAIYSGKIICLDASTGATLSQWSIHGNEYNRIALASDGAFIAASSDSSVSFWDATTHKQIGSVIEHTGKVECMAISSNNDIVIGGGNKITFRSLCDILPSCYWNNVSTFESRARLAAQRTAP